MADVNITIGAAFDELISTVDGIKSTIGDLAGILGGAFAVDQIASFIDSMAQLGRETERTASILGVSTQQVQEFNFIAKATGTSSEALSMMMERLQLGLQRAAVASSPQAAALKALGLSMKELVGIPLDEQMNRIADAVSKFTDGGNKTAAVLALIGRQGAAMIPVLDQGRIGLQLMRQTADSISISPESIQSLSRLDEATVTLRTAIGNLAATITSSFADAMTVAFNKTASLVGEMNKAIQSGTLWQRTMLLLKQAAVDWAESQPIAPPNEGALNAQLSAAQAEVSRAAGIKMLTDLMGHARQAKNTFDDMWNALLGIGQKKQVPGLGLDAAAAAAQAAKVAMQAAQDSVKLADEMYKGEAEQANAAAKAFQITEQQKTAILIEEINKRQDAEMAALQTALAAEKAGTPQYQKIQDQMDQITVKAANDRQSVIMAEVEKETQAWKSLADQLAGAFNSQLKGLLSGTETWAQAMQKIFADMILFMIEQVVKLIAEYVILNAVAAAFPGLGVAAPTIGGLISGMFSSHQVGSSYVPQTGLALVHQGEAIIPAGANPFQGSSVPAAAGGATTNNYGGGFNLSVSALDSRSFANFLLNNRRAMEQFFNVFTRQNTGILQQAGAAAQ